MAGLFAPERLAVNGRCLIRDVSARHYYISEAEDLVAEIEREKSALEKKIKLQQ